jgi:hypothetical protein
MRTLLLTTALLSFGFACAHAAKSKDTLPPILLSSHFVYVEALDGDQFDPHVIPDDRQAIVNVQQAIQNWNRYIITVKRADAELILLVRKGRIASVQPGVGIGGGSESGGRPDVVRGGASGDVGGPDDLLEVCILNPDGSRTGPIWTHTMKDGLAPPDMPLFQQFKQAVDSAAKAAKSPHS